MANDKIECGADGHDFTEWQEQEHRHSPNNDGVYVSEKYWIRKCKRCGIWQFSHKDDKSDLKEF